MEKRGKNSQKNGDEEESGKLYCLGRAKMILSRNLQPPRGGKIPGKFFSDRYTGERRGIK